MIARILADALIAIHLAFVLFVVLGGLLVFWRRIFLYLHPPAAIWGFLVEARGWFCPLTDLENVLRRRAGEAGYEGGFIEQYLVPVLYPTGLTRDLQTFLALVVVLSNAIIYGLILYRHRRG